MAVCALESSSRWGREQYLGSRVSRVNPLWKGYAHGGEHMKSMQESGECPGTPALPLPSFIPSLTGSLSDTNYTTTRDCGPWVRNVSTDQCTPG